MYQKTTRGFCVQVTPRFLEEQSDPGNAHYLWAYHVVISNEGAETARLLNRYWQITDAMGRVQEVHGPGVVGEQPLLEPKGSFDYTSGCPLPTASGMMVGHYEMQSKSGELFIIEIPPFSLDSPYQAVRLN